MAKIWPIGGGKGGSGKSFLVASIGNYLAKSGIKTLLIDTDLGAANLHTLIGVHYPTTSLSDFLNKKINALDQVVIQTRQPNLFLISGAKDSLEIANLQYAHKLKLLRAIYRLPYEYILLDVGGGTSFNTLDFFMISNDSIFITTPEPTSIENTYRFIRSIYIRKVKQIFKNKKFQPWLRNALDSDGKDQIKSHADLLAVIKQIDPEISKLMEKALNAFRFKLVVNQMRKQDTESLGTQFCQVCTKHLGLQMQFLGNISFDDRVHDALCQKVSFVDKYSYTQTALDLRAIYQEILSMDNGQSRARPKEVFASNP